MDYYELSFVMGTLKVQTKIWFEMSSKLTMLYPTS